MGARRREGGFTLVEILVVMAIVVTLFTLVALGVAGLRGRAAEKATDALLRRIMAHLDEYKNLTGTYPPDGIDSPVKNGEGTPIQGSACLYYFLAVKPTSVREIRAGKTFRSERPPLASFTSGEISEEDSTYPGVREVLDGWKNPLHYDNTEDGGFKAQGGWVHVPPLDDDEHPGDPREGDYEVNGENAVREAGIQGKGFDLWSHGEQEHEVKPLKALPIASWSLKG
ncbi:MAG: type II secretion system protein [Planctomycetes bacterium]|nr:type II secretion system protein [Planctomycetota bacterium]